VAAIAFALASLLPSVDPAAGTLNVPEAGLTFKMPPLEKVALVPSDDPLRLRLVRGWLGEKRIEISVWLFPVERFALAEPLDLVDESERRFTELSVGKSFEFTERQEFEGAYGYLSYAEFATGDLVRAADPTGKTTIAMAAFVTEKGACSIEAVLDGAVTESDRQVIREALTQGVALAGKPRDPRWTYDDLVQRWERDVPEKVRKDPMKPVARSAHFIVLTNSASGDAFAKKMEEHCAKVVAAYPIPERKGRRLLPILLFKSKEDYVRFCDAQKNGAGATTKGFAAKDFYATWSESPGDSVHLNEATRLVFRNLFGLAGGGAWFQDGIAGSMSTKREDRNGVAKSVAKGKALHLKELMQAGPSAAGGDPRDRAVEAALLIEFLRESEATKAKFLEFVAKVGAAPRHSITETDKALRASLGTSVDELDVALTDWCVKR
jgi:hypothetical protein